MRYASVDLSSPPEQVNCMCPLASPRLETACHRALLTASQSGLSKKKKKKKKWGPGSPVACDSLPCPRALDLRAAGMPRS